MNNIKGYKTDHSARIQEKQRLHVYRWMLREILDGNHLGEFLCHLLESYNEKHIKKYELDQFPELVMQRQSWLCWWDGTDDDIDYSYITHKIDTREGRMQLRSYILSDAIEFLTD